MGGGGLVEKKQLVLHSILGLGSAQLVLQLVLHSVPGLGSAQLRTTKAGLRGQTRRSVSIGEKCILA